MFTNFAPAVGAQASRAKVQHNISQSKGPFDDREHSYANPRRSLVSRGTRHKVLCCISRLFRQQSQQNIQHSKTVELYPDQDTFEFSQGHVTKNQPITVLVLLSERLGI